MRAMRTLSKIKDIRQPEQAMGHAAASWSLAKNGLARQRPSQDCGRLCIVAMPRWVFKSALSHSGGMQRICFADYCQQSISHTDTQTNDFDRIPVLVLNQSHSATKAASRRAGHQDFDAQCRQHEWFSDCCAQFRHPTPNRGFTADCGNKNKSWPKNCFKTVNKWYKASFSNCLRNKTKWPIKLTKTPSTKRCGLHVMCFVAPSVPILTKDFILTMLFLKYISDVWQDHYDGYKKEYGDEPELIAEMMKTERFCVARAIEFLCFVQSPLQ